MATHIGRLQIWPLLSPCPKFMCLKSINLVIPLLRMSAYVMCEHRPSGRLARCLTDLAKRPSAPPLSLRMRISSSHGEREEGAASKCAQGKHGPSLAAQKVELNQAVLDPSIYISCFFKRTRVPDMGLEFVGNPSEHLVKVVGRFADFPSEREEKRGRQ